MPIPAEVKEAAERGLAAYCADCVPEKVRHLLEITYRFDGNNAYVVERRPSTGRGKRWEECDVARFRYVVARDEWLLYWRDRDERWHRYEDRRPARRLATLLKEVEADPTCIFWG